MADNDLLQAISNLLDERLTPVNTKLEKLEADTSALRSGQLEIRKQLKEVKHKVSDTYDLALDAWGTSTENRNWLENDKLKAQ